jgi:protoporphyrinogen/coproporphyrinogen III oxidase
VGVAPGGYRLTTHPQKKQVKIGAPVVIPTIGAHTLGDIFPFFPPRHLEAITNLEYAKVVQVVLGFREWNGSDIRAFGGLVPGKEQRDILGVLFTSSFLSQRAPKGGALLNVFLGGTRNPEYYDLDDQQVKELVRREITEMMKLPAFDPSLVKVFRYRHAIPQYGADSEERLQAIQELQTEFQGLVLAGNLHEGIGMADRVAQAMRIAEATHNMLLAGEKA